MNHDPTMPSDGGHLDLPLSVWPDAGSRPELDAGLINAYTRPGQLVVDTTSAALIPAVAAGRRCDVLVAADRGDELRTELDGVEFTRRCLGHIRHVDAEDAPAALFAYIGDIDLLITTLDVAGLAGFWRACHAALARTGHAAVLVDTADAAEHARRGAKAHRRRHRDAFVFTTTIRAQAVL